MLACGHYDKSAAERVCEHLSKSNSPIMSYFRWYTGHDLQSELLCRSCLDARQAGHAVSAGKICVACLQRISDDWGPAASAHGEPGIRQRPEPMNQQLRVARLPTCVGKILDIAGLPSSHSMWLLLTDTESTSPGVGTTFDSICIHRLMATSQPSSTTLADMVRSLTSELPKLR
jgi:hypothetical protein